MTRVGFKLASPSVPWPIVEAMWRRAGELDAFDSAWTNDHLDMGDGIAWEGLTSLALLAHHVPRQRMGHLVLSNPFRHPAVLAKAAIAMDHATNGRFVLGLGVGSLPPEFASLGLALPPVRERLADLEAALIVIRTLFGRDSQARSPLSVEAPPYALREARSVPAPLTPGGPPIWLGTQGEQIGMRLVAAYADGWNFSSEGGLEAFGRRCDALHRHLDAVRRDPADVTISAQMPVGADLPAALRMARAYVAAGCRELILFLDPAAGVAGVEAVAREVAGPIRAG